MIDTWMAELPHGITLSCRSAGARGRPVLMFLHGFPEAAFVWDALMQHFARPEHGGFRCVAPNLRGYEQSSSPADVAAYRAKHLMQDVAALIAAESTDAQGAPAPLAALVAHDWGGAVAWNLAAERPALMQRLVIINSPHPQTFWRGLTHSPAQQAASAYMNFLIRPDAEALLAEGDFARLWPFFDLMGASGAPAMQRAATTLAGDAARPGNATTPPALPQGAGWMTEALRAQYRAVWQGDGSRPGAGLTGGLNYYRASPMRPPRAGDAAAAGIDLPPDAFRISVPTLLLWAMQDSALLPELTQGLAPWVPQLTLHPIEHATHWVVHEQPERVAREMGRFLGVPAAG
ncbi:MAG: alpha/beta fold hydrolase [Pseudomonadota bacterium]|nr:alpha/beta fold hydrolase [Pseudomonadota bacterium]